ncbi:MAG: hypothetical protein V1886_00760 [archaeon]
MNIIILDSSSIISLAMNSLLYLFRKMKKPGVRFIVTEDVKREIIETPGHIKKYELESLMIQQLVSDGTFESPESINISPKEIGREKEQLMQLANHTFNAKGEWIHIISHGETSCLALARIAAEKGFNCAFMVDERTARMLCEMPLNLKKLLESKLHTPIRAEEKNFELFSGIKIIRSSELAYVAYKKSLMGLPDGKHLVDAFLYALKFKGCAISGQEIEELKRL